MLFSKILLPLTALMATATAAPSNFDEEHLLKRLEEANARADASIAAAAYAAAARAAPTPILAVRSSDDDIPSSDDSDIDTSLTSIPSDLPNFPPDFDPYNSTLPLPAPTAVLDSRNPSPAVEDYMGGTPDRDQAKYNGPYTYASHYCGEPKKWASLSAIHDGQSYLYGLAGEPHLQANKCSRVSCSWNSAIFVCNDNNHDITLHSWGNVAEASYFLSGACFKYFGGQTRVAGQVYFSERWTVFMTVQRC